MGQSSIPQRQPAPMPALLARMRFPWGPAPLPDQLRLGLLRTAESLRQACFSLVPYLFLTSVVGLAAAMLPLFMPGDFAALHTVQSALRTAFPALLLLAIAYHHAAQLSLNRPAAIVLAAALGHVYSGLLSDHTKLLFPRETVVGTLVLPLVSIGLLAVLHGWVRRRVKPRPVSLSRNLLESLGLIPAFIATFGLMSWLLVLVAAPAANGLHAAVDALRQALTAGEFLFFRLLGMHAIWATGLHGDNLFDLLFGADRLQQALSGRLDYFGFYNVFVLQGGAGAGLSLWLALLIGARDMHARQVAVYASPLVLFNAPEVLLFGVPVVLNRQLLAPFFIVPTVNFIVAYTVVQQGWLGFPNPAPPWCTPVLLKSWLATGGNPLGPLLELALLGLGTAIYLPFVRRYTRTQSATLQGQRIAQRLGVGDEMRSINDVGFFRAQKDIIQTHLDVERVVLLLEHQPLAIHYQPKVALSGAPGRHLEALLRIHMADGSVRGPFFLETLEQAGLATVIDLWVCQSVRHDLGHWAAQGVQPEVSINLHPDTVANRSAVDRITGLLRGHRIEFEIIERADSLGAATTGNLALMRARGFKVALDDFGSGYSGLGLLAALPVDTVKIDRSLLLHTGHAAGREIFLGSAALCRRLGLQSVVEGVEEPAQLDLARQAQADYVQGYLTGRPMPGEAALAWLRAQAPAPAH